MLGDDSKFLENCENYIFSDPRAGLLAINKKKLSMKRSPDNQINTFLIDISRIKSLVFCYGRLSSTQLDRLQAPKQQPSIDQRLVKQTDANWLKIYFWIWEFGRDFFVFVYIFQT